MSVLHDINSILQVVDSNSLDVIDAFEDLEVTLVNPLKAAYERLQGATNANENSYSETW